MFGQDVRIQTSSGRGAVLHSFRRRSKALGHLVRRLFEHMSARRRVARLGGHDSGRYVGRHFRGRSEGCCAVPLQARRAGACPGGKGGLHLADGCRRIRSRRGGRGPWRYGRGGAGAACCLGGGIERCQPACADRGGERAGRLRRGRRPALLGRRLGAPLRRGRRRRRRRLAARAGGGREGLGLDRRRGQTTRGHARYGLGRRRRQRWHQEAARPRVRGAQGRGGRAGRARGGRGRRERGVGRRVVQRHLRGGTILRSLVPRRTRRRAWQRRGRGRG
mmetsp:Transcript_17316/g.60513  ORF Transcript_17316/g.60513 Transcript_17316/m.60513 type:complete len:277 (+) Transcript_17316:1172-2002(+)